MEREGISYIGEITIRILRRKKTSGHRDDTSEQREREKLSRKRDKSEVREINTDVFKTIFNINVDN